MIIIRINISIIINTHLILKMIIQLVTYAFIIMDMNYRNRIYNI